ncbi:hypothetical protein ACZ90_59360 [Streptomyces albus subsp. albus]|uniref:DUF5753 domain-containing protein n=2 Tax=Actinomycetes TaxID=1760 RepID=UPI0004BD8205|nr:MULTISPECIES: DUF5753 domain-containing protein [Streptomyces]KOG76948.1 hypothetical protein ADK33_32560 [Streptomyces griseus subsp. rhodochrous]KUJ64232.1 hypothetical protein ACZ90_59360 [Streptomyces albus subsp. albus]
MPATDPLSLDEQLHRLLDLEAAARHIHGWHPTLMPGMLQTADYARAAIRASAPALPPHDVEKRATGRTVRIDTLGRAAGRTARFVIGEAVLRQPVGGPATLAAQLDHLMTLLALRPTLDVRVLPQGEAHPGLYGPFTVYQGRPGRTVFIEHLAGTAVINTPERALSFIHASDNVGERAASPVDSLRMIEAARKRLAHA